MIKKLGGTKQYLIASTLTITTAIILSGCLPAIHGPNNSAFDNALTQQVCSDDFFKDYQNKLDKNDDVIYNGLNAGLIAKNCSKYKLSNTFLDKAEESYKYDIDLKGMPKKAADAVASTLLNESFLDYQGSLYERIMVNAYKGLNFMALGDFQDARVEFNRALMRQDKAKEYFAKQIRENRKEFDKLKNMENAKEAIKEGLQDATQQVSGFLKEFQTTKNFVNPYATYLASVFFFMDRDYRRAADLFREVTSTYPKSKELQREKVVFDKYANSVRGDNKKYIFLSHEDGMGVIKEQFAITVPFPISDSIATASLAFPKLVKRDAAYPSVKINGHQTSLVSNFDDIIATEYKIEMPAMITKALIQTAIKTGVNATVANNDSTGGILSLATSLFNTATTRADVRIWRGLPKTASVAMVENKGKIKVISPDGKVLVERKVNPKKNVLVIVRTFKDNLPSSVMVVEK